MCTFIITIMFCIFLKGSGPLYSFLRFCILGNSIDELELVEEGKVVEEKEENSSSPTPKGYGSVLWSSFKLCSCIIGLQIAYLTWGVLQVCTSMFISNMGCVTGMYF